MKLEMSKAEVQELLQGPVNHYPKYTTQLLNLANQNAHGTRPKVVGQLSDLIQEFDGQTLAEWETWYLEGHPKAIDQATAKVYAMIERLKKAILAIDEPMVKSWVEELVVVKTFAGLKFQEAILKRMALHYDTDYRLAAPEEESQGIDGYLGNIPVSIKPTSYRSKLGLNETIDSQIAYYQKERNGISIEFEDLKF